MLGVSLALLLAAPAPARDVACEPIPGADAWFAMPGLRWMIVGEMHGTAETPAGFAALVCLASVGRTVTVAVEQPASDQPAIDAYLASDGGEAARAAFLAAPMWNQPVKDGRSSKACFELFEALRLMVREGKVSRVVAFQPVLAGPFDAAGYERDMADLLRNAASKPGELVLALVGNVHAMRQPFGTGERAYMPAAGLLPGAETVTFNAVGDGGGYWACTPAGCGPQAGAPAAHHMRGIALLERQPWSGTFYLGTATTASPPAVP